MAREIEEGHSVENGVLKRLSVSQVKTFDPNAEGGCERKWFLARVLHQPMGPPSRGVITGVEGHSRIEHYLRTGGKDDVLGTIERVGKHLIPAPGADLLIEASFKERKGLDADGVPFVGYIDLEHGRGEYVDGYGALQTDPPNTREVIDWKFSSDVARYAKTSRDLSTDVQMVGYGEAVLRANPTTENVRSSHVYFSTKKREAAKITVLQDSATIHRTWEEQITPIVRSMRDVAKETDPSKVHPNFDSCSTFGGCPFKGICLYGSSLAVKPENHMGLLEKMKANNGVTQPPPLVAPPEVTKGREEVTQPSIQVQNILPPDAPAPVKTAPPAEEKPAEKAKPGPKPKAKEATSVAIYADCIPYGVSVTPLEGYISTLTSTLEKKFNCPDIRVAEEKGPLGFGKWKGALASLARESPPAPGTYFVITNGSEFAQIVIEALSPTLPPGSVTRGVR